MNQSDIETFNEGFGSGEYAALESVIRHCVRKAGRRGEELLRLLLAEIEEDRGTWNVIWNDGEGADS